MILALFMGMLCAFLVACSNSVGVPSQEQEISQASLQEDSLQGMIRVNVSNAVVSLGANNSEANAIDRPQMKVSLDYAFSLGRHEVTCAEFNSLMSAATGLETACNADDIPASDMTYYDAVLYANLRSKNEGFDTAYVYGAATFDSRGSCTHLDGLAFHPEVDAYRLPTEAEWVLAASVVWKETDGWTSENSGYVLHGACSREGQKLKLCDMAGNVMEWANDWFGNLRDTSVVNYVGAPDGGMVGRRIVKGGSFRNAAASIHLYSRGDVYTVTSASHADYIGFRLAFGKIPNAVWLNSSGEASESPVRLLAGLESMRPLAGSPRAKLVFRNEVSGNLSYVEYSLLTPVVVDLPGTSEAYHPELSPNGRLIAYSTGMEGVSGKSSLFVRSLNSYDSNAVRLDVESAAIPRWRVLANGDTAIVYVTDAGNNVDAAAFKQKSTWQVTFMGGKFGTPQKLMDGAFHGGISADNRLAVTGARLLRSRIASSDTVWYAGEQACNVSLATDGSKRTAFLDFGEGPGREFVGSAYGVHERIFIADSTGKLVHSVPAPAGFSFDHVEWAHGVEDVLVATLTDVNGNHKKIVAVNIQDNRIVDLVEGEDLWMPMFWAKNMSSSSSGNALDPDSAGVYYAGVGSEAEIFYRYKLELLWNYRTKAEIVTLGSSRMLNGVNPLLLQDSWDAINMATVPNTMYTSMFVFENYVLPHVSNIKYLLVSLDLDLWYKNDTDDNYFYEQYLFNPGIVYDMNHGFWKDGVPDGLADATVDAPGSDYFKLVLTKERGFYAESSGNWGTDDLVNFDSTWRDYRGAEFDSAFAHFANIVRLAKENDIVVVGIIFPQSPEFRQTGSFGRYGIRRSEMPAIMERLDSLDRANSNFVLFDENKMGDHDYPAEMAANQDHLNRLGAEQLTHRLDSLLKRIEVDK